MFGALAARNLSSFQRFPRGGDGLILLIELLYLQYDYIVLLDALRVHCAFILSYRMGESQLGQEIFLTLKRFRHRPGLSDRDARSLVTA